MRLGVFGDIHGNQPALEAVLDALDEHDVDIHVCLGDIVGVLGSPDSCVSLVRSVADIAVYGNHDSRVFPDRTFLPQRDVDVIEYELITDRVSESNLDWLKNLPSVVSFGDGVTVAHSRPTGDDPEGTAAGDPGIYPRHFERVGRAVLDETGGILLLGHTHVQHGTVFECPEGQGIVCNPGCIGLPFDLNPESEACIGRAEYAIVDTDSFEFELCDVRYQSDDVVHFLDSNGVTSLQ